MEKINFRISLLNSIDGTNYFFCLIFFLAFTPTKTKATKPKPKFGSGIWLNSMGVPKSKLSLASKPKSKLEILSGSKLFQKQL